MINMTFNPQPKPGKKKKRKNDRLDPKYIEWIKKQSCCHPNCKGKPSDIVPAHSRSLGNGGTGMKPKDLDCLPLCFFCHLEENDGAVKLWGQGTKAKTKIFVQNLVYEHIGRYMLG